MKSLREFVEQDLKGVELDVSKISSDFENEELYWHLVLEYDKKYSFEAYSFVKEICRLSPKIIGKTKSNDLELKDAIEHELVHQYYCRLKNKNKDIKGPSQSFDINEILKDIDIRKLTNPRRAFEVISKHKCYKDIKNDKNILIKLSKICAEKSKRTIK